MLSFVYGDGNAAGKCWLRGGKVPLSGCLYWLRETGVRRGKKQRKKEEKYGCLVSRAFIWKCFAESE